MDWKAFKDIKTADELAVYMKERAFMHRKYYHYTSADIVNSILGQNEFWLSCVSKFNDKNDSNQFTPQKEYYALCFSTGASENLPLWYLYSGIDGKGARLALNSSHVRALIENGRYNLYELDDENKRGDHVLELKEGKNMSLTVEDVIYRSYSQKRGKAFLSYNTLFNKIMLQSEMEKYEEKHRGFQKNPIWYYERETRLLVKLEESAKKLINSNCSKERKYVVICKFDKNLQKEFAVTFAPDVKEDQLSSVIKEYPFIKSFNDVTSRVSASRYAGEIDMGLVEKKIHKSRTEN